jgi:hypothetical protein
MKLFFSVGCVALHRLAICGGDVYRVAVEQTVRLTTDVDKAALE